MRKIVGLTFILVAVIAANAMPLTLREIAAQMRSAHCYSAKADYEVLLPNFADPVHYDISLFSQLAVDTLAPCNYVIDWTLETPVSHSEGFTAYFSGTHFRYRDRRLQEYHIEEGADVFAPLGDHTRGVQYQAQFCELLPAFIADRFETMATDTTYQFTIKERTTVKISGVRRIMGYDSVEFEYELDSQSLMPLKIELENNPGQIGEQVVTITYSATTLPADCSIDLQTISASHSEVFEKYRSNSFTLEQLVGAPLPQFTARTLEGERFAHNKGESNGSPLILVFLDTEVGTTPEVISSVRQAVEYLPMNLDVIWAFMNRRPDDIMNLIGSKTSSETVLVNAASAARECGVGALTPVLIFVDSTGNVTDFNIGFNQDLQSVVIQKAGLSMKH